VVNAHSWPFFAKAAGNSGMFSMWNAMPIGSETLFSSSYSSPVIQCESITNTNLTPPKRARFACRRSRGYVQPHREQDRLHGCD
jgi:hypothetical protein